MTPSLDGVRLKVSRARHHFDAVSKLAQSYSSGQHKIVRQQDSNTGAIQYLLELPDIVEPVALVIGDCIHNLRTALDHIVWQLVIRNGKTPGTSNMFPIRQTTSGWARAIASDMLCGVHVKAKRLIENLQPYKSPANAPLLVLNDLENIDKHRQLLTIRRASVAQLIRATDRTTGKPVGGTRESINVLVPIEHGESVYTTFAGHGDAWEDVDLKVQATLNIAFKEKRANGEICLELGKLVDFVEQAVIPRFEPLF